MCGVAGKLANAPDAPIDRRLLVAMADKLAHRGPDADGYYVAPGIGLAHRRLSILDVAAGHQPLTNEDGTVWVSFNGEIYNFAELRQELLGRGHTLRTHSDTEVIVHAYEEWGVACVERFRGMFAFALWDGRARRLLLARDRVGIKPMYYAQCSDGLVFGSEIKALLEEPTLDRTWSPEAVDAYLALLYVPSPQTIYAHVHKLPPGHVLVAEHGRITLHKYWDLEFQTELASTRAEDYLEELDAQLAEAVSSHLVSEVPLGAFLSGGIDSTAVVAYMAQAADAPVLASSVGFNERAFNELDKARAVASHLGCEHVTRVIAPRVADLLPRLAWHFDEPFADSSAVPTYYVSAAARERVTVALSGDGGDELWAGYAWHRVEMWESRVRRWLGDAGCRLAAGVGRQLPLSVKGARSLRHLGVSDIDACASKYSYDRFEDADKQALYSDGFAARTRESDPFASARQAYAACRSKDPLDRVMYVDVKTYLPDDILTKVDRMSMAVSLESRVPLLDHKLIEFAATVPSSLKLRGGTSKYLLRRILEKRVPRSIVDAPKHGFTLPVGEWLRGPLAGLTTDLLFDGRLHDRGLFRDKGLRRLWDEHRTGRRDHRHRLWSLVMLELWFREFVDRQASSAADGAAA